MTEKPSEYPPSSKWIIRLYEIGSVSIYLTLTRQAAWKFSKFFAKLGVIDRVSLSGLIFAIWILLAICPVGHSERVIDVENDLAELHYLGRYLELYVGRDGIDEVSKESWNSKFIKSDNDVIMLDNWDLTSSEDQYIWMRARFRNTDDKSKIIYISADKFSYHDCVVYLNGQKLYTLSMNKGIQRRFALPVELAPNMVSSLYFRIIPGSSHFFALEAHTDLDYAIEATSSQNENMISSSLLLL